MSYTTYQSFSITVWLLISDNLPSGLLRSHVGGGSRSLFHTDKFSLFISSHITQSEWLTITANSQHGHHTKVSRLQLKPSEQIFHKGDLCSSFFFKSQLIKVLLSASALWKSYIFFVSCNKTCEIHLFDKESIR